MNKLRRDKTKKRKKLRQNSRKIQGKEKLELWH